MSQKQANVEKELKALRAQVEALTRAQAEAAAEASDAVHAEIDAPVEEESGAATLDFQELVDLLKHEVEDMNPLTALAIFGLGVLTGRLLSH